MEGSIHDEASQSSGPPKEQSLPVHRDPTSSSPIEMKEIEEHSPNGATRIPQPPTASIAENTIHQPTPSVPSKTDQPDTQPPLASASSSTPLREPLAITSANNDTSPLGAAPYPLTREKTAPAIGPSFDKPAPLPQESEVVGPSLLITLLLITGARHPYKIDERYLKKRNVKIDGNNPVNMSVYTLKELIWREWRDGESDRHYKASESQERDRVADTYVCRLGDEAFESECNTFDLLWKNAGG
ncbi:MAG: hypothetical protein Q9226_002410 [Calogaya cf. arnoldii]